MTRAPITIWQPYGFALTFEAWARDNIPNQIWAGFKTLAKKKRREIDYGPLAGLLGFQLRRAQLLLFQDFAREFANDNISPGQAGVLLLIEANPGLSQSDLATAVGVERSTLGEVVEALLARQLVERSVSKSDRRSYALRLSTAGHKFAMTMLDRIHAHEARVTGDLTREERSELENALHKLNGV